MMKRIFLALITLVVLKSTILGQDNLTFTTYSNTNYFIDNKEVLYTSFGINPALLTDSNQIYFDFVRYQNKEYDTNGGYYLYGETALKDNDLSLGFLFNSNNIGIVDEHYLTGSIKKKIQLGTTSKLNIATSIGVWRMRIDVPYSDVMDPTLFSGKTDWSYVPVMDLGLSYNYKNQTLGISYKNLINSDFKLLSEEFESGENGLIVNYKGIYNPIGKIYLIPEVYGCFNKDDKYAIAMCRIKYLNFVSASLLYNTNESYGFSISGLILKRIKLGYYSDFEIRESWNGKKLSNHGINLGFIIL